MSSTPVMSALKKLKLNGTTKSNSNDSASASSNPADPLVYAESQCRHVFSLLLGVSFFINLLVLTTPLYMMQVFDRVLSSGNPATLFMLTLIACLALAVWGALEIVRSQILSRVGVWVTDTLTPHLLSAGVRGSLQGLAANTQPLKDLQVLSRFYGGNSLKSITDIIWIPFFVFVLWMLHPLIGTMSIGFGASLVILAIMGEATTRKRHQDVQSFQMQNSQDAEIAVRNAEAVWSMGMFDNIVARWKRRNDTSRELFCSMADARSLLAGISRTVRMFAQISVLGLGAWLVLKQQLTPGGMIAGSILLSRALGPVEQIIGSWRYLIDFREARKRLQIASSLVPEKTHKTPLPRPSGTMMCNNVTYLPRGSEKPVLRGITFKTDAGRSVGVAGPSAAGKSTLCKLIVGAWQPTAGKVSLDGACLTQWDEKTFGKYVGYMPQDVQLFHGTVTENIARLQVEPDADAVIQAAQLANVHEMILGLPSGYDTVIGAGGVHLSGGQRQRIGLARAFYGKPCLLVLDEPSANLDAIGEASLVKAIKEASNWGATVFVVAHTGSILSAVDDILYMRNGELANYGPKEKLMRPVTASGAGAAQTHPAANAARMNSTDPPINNAKPAVEQGAKIVKMARGAQGGDAT